MVIKHFSRVQEVASNTPNGATAFNLPGTAATGYRTFAACYANTDLLPYFATNGTDWESGIGTFTTGSPNTIVRTAILESSNSDAAVDFSAGADVTLFVEYASKMGQSVSDAESFPHRYTHYGFEIATAYRAWQGAHWWNNCIIVATDKNESYVIQNILSIYAVDGTLLFEFLSAYTGLDPQGKKLSFGSPYVIGNYLYMTGYNFNDGGSPLISRVIRYVLDPIAITITLDTSFGTSGVIGIGSGTAEQVYWTGTEWLVCYFDHTYISRFDASWTLLGTMALSQAFPAPGGPQAMIWKNPTEVHIIMHGQNSYGGTKSNEIHKYTRSGNTLTFVAKYDSPDYGLGQGVSACPFGYVWANRPANAIWFTKGLTKSRVAPIAYRNYQNELYKPTLSNGWVDFDATYDRAIKVYHDRNTGRAWMEGMAKSGATTLGTVLFTLPAHLRPKFGRNYPIVSNYVFGAIAIAGNNGSGTPGNVTITAASAAWISLDGISWLVDDVGGY